MMKPRIMTQQRHGGCNRQVNKQRELEPAVTRVVSAILINGNGGGTHTTPQTRRVNDCVSVTHLSCLTATHQLADRLGPTDMKYSLTLAIYDSRFLYFGTVLPSSLNPLNLPNNDLLILVHPRIYLLNSRVAPSVKSCTFCKVLVFCRF